MTSNPFPAGTVDHAVCDSIYNYPSLFANRTQVLHFFFVVLGTGVEWSNGGLVNYYDAAEVRTDAEVIAEMPAMLKRKTGDPQFDALVDEEIALWDARNTETLSRRRRAAELALTPGPLAGPVYDPYPTVPYFNVPANVKPDWAAAREEIGTVVEPLWYAGDHLQRFAPKPPPKLDSKPLHPEVVALLRDLWGQA